MDDDFKTVKAKLLYDLQRNKMQRNTASDHSADIFTNLVSTGSLGR